MIADRIITLRKTAGLNQAQLAKKLNVSPSAIGMYEQGRRTPGIDILILLAQIFDVSLDYLLTGLEYPHTKEYSPAKQKSDYCPCKTCYWKEYKNT